MCTHLKKDSSIRSQEKKRRKSEGKSKKTYRKTQKTWKRTRKRTWGTIRKGNKADGTRTQTLTEDSGKTGVLKVF